MESGEWRGRDRGREGVGKDGRGRGRKTRVRRGGRGKGTTKGKNHRSYIKPVPLQSEYQHDFISEWKYHVGWFLTGLN